MKVAPALLARVAPSDPHVPACYHHPRAAMRWVFWRRLASVVRALERVAARRGRVLDLGCGNGVLLPTLAAGWREVIGLDRDVAPAAAVVAAMGCAEVRLIAGDFVDCPAEAPVDAVVCADVLEHCRDLGPPIAAILRWLRDDGVLVTSLPTENRLYALLRVPFGQIRPPDHYHTAAEVEAVLRARGFRPAYRRQCPLGLPLFRIAAWRPPAAGARPREDQAARRGAASTSSSKRAASV